jgi:hypothetical protein
VVRRVLGGRCCHPVRRRHDHPRGDFLTHTHKRGLTLPLQEKTTPATDLNVPRPMKRTYTNRWSR